MSEKEEVPIKRVKRLFEKLLLLSESRGKEAIGFAFFSRNHIHVFKEGVSASLVLRSNSYKKFWNFLISTNNLNQPIREPFAILGHSRLVTNGLRSFEHNNQPISKDGVLGIHNGIIVNDLEIWKQYPNLQKKYDVDSEVIFSLIRYFLEKGNDLTLSIIKSFKEIKGSASIAACFDDQDTIALATNTGSLYSLSDQNSNCLIFASEKEIINIVKKDNPIKSLRSGDVNQIKPLSGVLFNLHTKEIKSFTFQETEKTKEIQIEKRDKHKIVKFDDWEDRRERLLRCKNCILPETFPGIIFNEIGVCNVCLTYIKSETKGKDALNRLIMPHKNKKEPDCLVAFSGGRDSSYMLHYLKQELGLNPIAYSYDWGMVTNIARRNQARMTGKLGIEHILISADIKYKRQNILKNIKAWLKRPSLGMIPLFMAGDKQYFYYANRLRKKMGIELVFLGGNPMERTGFKTGFTGIQEEGKRTYDIHWNKKLKLITYYFKEFLFNPAYLNRSLLDTAFAYYSSYMMDHNFLWFYQYVPWDENQIEKTLKDEYQWESASDTQNTWRIGDGTVSFYNYIYHTVAGFTENDTFRSNQIREGLINREDALIKAKQDNKPRIESLKEYAYDIGFDLDNALSIIHAMPKLY